ncbi:hypothetical protein [Flavobacterium sasangense]|uniref:hypothetical protein n=1 Tax=Flavobacterium sasangense TaxID=503361 RepID=UPI000479C7DD|nr:hypothetical protein [Flavobacterium sasangense]
MKKILLVAVLAILASCENITTKNNAPEDIEFAKELATKFYEELSNKDTTKISSYLDKSIPKEELGKLVKKNLQDYGEIIKVDINKTQTSSVTKNDVNETKYSMEILTIYQKGKTLDEISFTKDNNKGITLNSYLVHEVIE